MNMDMFKDLTNAQLKEECQAQGITNIPAKSPGKPNKDEYLAAIANKLSYGGEDEPVITAEDVAASRGKAPVRRPKTRAQLDRLEMFRKDRVIVHDVQDNQSKDKDETISISWGNIVLGGQTDLVSMNGNPQYVRRGAINNLLSSTTVVHKPRANGNGVDSEVVPRFIVTEVAGMTPEELKDLITKQSMRNAKYA